MFAAVASAQLALLRAGGILPGGAGHHAPELSRALAIGLRKRGAELPLTLKLMLLLAGRLDARAGGATYARALNAAAAIRADVDRALREADVLLMPTTPYAAHRHAPDAGPAERVRRGDAMLTNTGTFDVTGHPSLSAPAGLTGDGLPVGAMLTGRHGDDARLLAVARTYEAAVGWRGGAQPR
jgi:amidase